MPVETVVECDPSVVNSRSYGVYTLADNGLADSVLTFQLVLNHAHASKTIVTKAKYSAKYDNSFLGSAALGVGSYLIMQLIAPDVNQFLFKYLAGALVGVSLIGSVTRSSWGSYQYTGIKRERKLPHKPGDKEYPCLFSDCVGKSYEFLIIRNEKQIRLTSDLQGRFSFNPYKDLGVSNTESLSNVIIDVVCEPLQINQSIGLKTYNSDRSMQNINCFTDNPEQMQLAEIVFWSKVRDEKMQAISSLTDSRLLTSLIFMSPDDEMAKAELLNITDNSALFYIAKNYKHPEIQKLAISRVKDDIQLANFFVEVNDAELQRYTLSLINEPTILRNIAQKSLTEEIYLDVAVKLKDQKMISSVAMGTKKPGLKAEALLLITDTILIARLACDTADKVIQKHCIGLINDQELLNKIFNESHNEDIRNTIVSRINDQQILMQIATKSKDNDLKIFKSAISKIEDQQAVYKSFFNSDDIDVKNAIISRIDDQALLYDITMHCKINNCMWSAFRKIKEQDYLIKIVQQHKDYSIKLSIFDKLDERSLNTLANSATVSSAVLAARIINRRTEWENVFSKVGRGLDLGTVLAAVALVRYPQPTASDVVNACHTYIKIGDSSIIPELIDLLNRFGDIDLAEDYLNCGNNRLSDAAASWGRSHGYQIETGPGSHRASWGEGR